MKKRKSFLLVTLLALIAVFTVVRTATSPYQKIRRYVAQHREPLTAGAGERGGMGVAGRGGQRLPRPQAGERLVLC